MRYSIIESIILRSGITLLVSYILSLSAASGIVCFASALTGTLTWERTRGLLLGEDAQSVVVILWFPITQLIPSIALFSSDTTERAEYLIQG